MMTEDRRKAPDWSVRAGAGVSLPWLGGQNTKATTTATPQVPRAKRWAASFRYADTLDDREVTFLWRPYIPAGAVTLLFGYGGLGKSYITCALAADITTGRPLPGHERGMPPQKVLMISAEDDPAVIIKPRLRALGADLTKIAISDDLMALKNLTGTEIADVIKQFAATMVFLDPLVSFIGEKIDFHKANETRGAMAPLSEAARLSGTAIVVVHHSRKDGSARSANRALGSADIINGVRSGIMVDQAKDGSTFLEHVKHNWSKKGPTLSYRVQNDTTGEAFTWGQFGQPDVSTKPRTFDKARDIIAEALSEGPQPMKDVIALGQQYGVSERTMLRAKDDVAESYRPGGTGAWLWRLKARIIVPEGSNGKVPQDEA